MTRSILLLSLAVFLLLLLVSSATARPIDGCVFISASAESGAHSLRALSAGEDVEVLAANADYAWNLSPLNAGNKALSSEISPYTYDFNVCGFVKNAADEAGCTNATGASMIQRITKANTCAAVMSKWDSSTVQWELINDTVPTMGIQYTTNDGSVCDNEGIKLPRQVTWRFTCDESAVRNSPLTLVEEESNVTECLTVLEIKSACACPGKTCHSNRGGGGGGGLSGGWVFIILLFVGGVLYGAIGCGLNHNKGATGVELCPNHEFWAGLPGLVAEGFRFTVGKIRGAGGGGDSYQAA